MENPSQIIFDTNRVRMHRARASEDFLLREMVERLADRLQDMNRAFPMVLDLSAKAGMFAEYLPESKIEWADILDEVLDVPAAQYDLVISAGALHWVNDLPGMLIQMQRALKPDGLLLAMMPGGETLKELRASFEAAEMQLTGGISPRVSPFVDIRDGGALLQRAGFALPVADNEVLDVHYAHPLKLLHDLRNMGQANALVSSRKHFTSCTLMMQMADYYLRNFEAPDGKVAATFELLTLTAWKPHASQQQPAKRGSGKVNLAVLGN